MNSHEGAPEREELQRLRERLEVLSIRHSAELDSIRSRILALEVAYDSAPTAAQEPVPESPKPQAKPVALPPPLPKVPVFEEIEPVRAPAPVRLEIPAIPPKSDESFELDFGKVWFVRIGIVILLTGLVFLGNYAYQNWIREMSNGLRLTALFFCSGLLAETGRRLAQKRNLNRFGEVLLAGGMAFFYYCTFAAHHVARLKVIDSPSLAAVLLFISAGAIAAVSWIRQAKVTAAIGLVLASYATMLQPIGWMSCVSNLLLAAIGLFFMLKPGWTGPGWASMLGSYGAFLGSQVFGHHEFGYSSNPLAMLCFLPPLWIMYAVPGMLGRFRESLSDRGRAWFTGVNHVLFFVLLSALWIDQYGDADYWRVAAVFGSVLLVMGMIGRRQSTIAGGVNIAQGLSVVTFALVLKLDGHQLALVLAMVSLSLALAAWKFRSRSEVVFSLLTGLGSTFLMIGGRASFFGSIPVWSIALTALTIAAASVAMARVKPLVEIFHVFVRLTSVLLLISAALIANHLCLFRIEPSHGLITAGLFSLGLSAAYLKLDTKHYQPESIWISLWFLAVSGWLGLDVSHIWPLSAMLGISLAACGLWHRQPKMEKIDPAPDLTYLPGIPAWSFSLASSFFTWQITDALSSGYREAFLFHQIGALALLAVAILIRCQRLTITAALPAILSLGLLVAPRARDVSHLFAAVILAFAAASLLYSPWGQASTTVTQRKVSSVMFRFTAFIAYMIGWHEVSPEAWGDWIALTSIIGIIGIGLLKRRCFEECVGWIFISVLWLFVETLTASWSPHSGGQSWHGVIVIVSLLVITAGYKMSPPSIDNLEDRRAALGICAGLTCFMITLWATHMLVWRLDWKPAAVLWTILGFMFVSAGLWQRLHVARVMGFLLLAASLGKLFIFDVWDFTAFMRVVSFIVLGTALILLGLFYNKFAPAIKTLLEAEK